MANAFVASLEHSSLGSVINRIAVGRRLRTYGAMRTSNSVSKPLSSLQPPIRLTSSSKSDNAESKEGSILFIARARSIRHRFLSDSVALLPRSFELLVHAAFTTAGSISMIASNELPLETASVIVCRMVSASPAD